MPGARAHTHTQPGCLDHFCRGNKTIKEFNMTCIIIIIIIFNVLPVASILPATVTLRNSRCHGLSAAPGKCCTWVEHPSQIPSAWDTGRKRNRAHTHTHYHTLYKKNKNKKKITTTKKNHWKTGVGGDLDLYVTLSQSLVQANSADLSHWKRVDHWRTEVQWRASARISALCQTSLIQTSLPARESSAHSVMTTWRFFLTSPPIAFGDPARAHMISPWTNREQPGKWIHIFAVAIGSFECTVVFVDWSTIFRPYINI